MRPRVFAALGLALALATGARLQGAEPHWRVRTEVEIIALPLTAGGPLLSRLMDPETEHAALVEVDEAVRSGRAELLHRPVSYAASGERTVAEDWEEFVWGEEHDPSADPRPQAFPGELPPPPRPLVDARMQVGWGPFTPSEFLAEHLGSTLEAAPVVASDGKTVRLDVVLSWHALDRGVLYRTGTDPGGVYGFRYQPWFFLHRVRSFLRLQSGRRVLLGSFIQQTPQPRVMLFLLEVTVHAL